MSGPRMTVIVLTYNRRHEVLRTVAALQELPDHPALIVVDNASSDGTAEALTAVFPTLELVRARSNLGAAGRNLGAAAATTEYIAFCDDDTCWEPRALAIAQELLDAAPEVAVLNARILVGEEGRLDPSCAGMARSALGEIVGVGPRLAGFMAGACVMRRRVYLDAGGYDPRLFLGGEEALLALDILDRGHAIAYAPAVVTRHWPSLMRDAALRRRYLARNALWTAWLRLPWYMALRESCRTLAELPGARARLRAVSDALAQWRRLAGARRVVGAQARAQWALRRMERD